MNSLVGQPVRSLIQSERLFGGMVLVSFVLHVALFVIPGWFGDSTDAASLPVSRGRVTIRLNRQTVPEVKPPEKLETVTELERITPPLPPRPISDLPSPAIVAARPELERVEPREEQPIEPPQRIERATPNAKPDPTKLDELDLHAAGQEGAEVDDPASALYNPLPPYPPSALRRAGGTVVVLRVRVSAAGLAEFAQVAQTCGDPQVDEATRAFVAKYWRFRPARRRGVAVPQLVEVQVRYR